MDLPPAVGNFVTIATAPWNLTSWNGTTGTWVTSTIPIVWLTAIRWVGVPSSGPRNYFSTFNSWILLSSCGAKYTHWDFRLLLVRNLIEEAGKSHDRPNPRLVGRPSSGAKIVLWLESRHNKHWPAKSSTQLRCRLHSSRGQRKGTVRQMWCGPVRGALFREISHRSKFVNHPNCEYCVSW